MTETPAMASAAPCVTRVRYFSTPTRRAPQAGDRRVTKKHGLQIRIHVRAKDWQGRPFGFLVRGGRPVYEWCEPQHLPAWDRHFLSPEEKAKHFPPEREPGYMQGRGAA